MLLFKNKSQHKTFNIINRSSVYRGVLQLESVGATNTSKKFFVVTTAEGHLQKQLVATGTYLFCSFKFFIGPQKSNTCLVPLVPGLFQPLFWVTTVAKSYPHLCTSDRTSQVAFATRLQYI